MSVSNSVFGMLMYALRSSAPVALASIGGTFCARSGVMALGMEGFMLMGSFFAVFMSWLTGSAFLGLLFGVFMSCLYAMLFALLSVRYKVNQVMCGVALNLLALGFTASMTQIVWGIRTWSDPVATLGKLTLPFVGSVSLFIPLALVLAVVGWLYLFKTPWGLRLRVVGQNPMAATSLGIPVNRYKYFGCLMCGLMCGLGGSYLSIDHVNRFALDMTAGRGYIAVAVNILGRSNPIGALGGSLLFGLADSVQTVVSANVPGQLMEMIPYILTVIVVYVGARISKTAASREMA